MSNTMPETTKKILDGAISIAHGLWRVPVTVSDLYTYPQIQAYLYNKEADEMGLDPWMMIAGIDQNQKDGVFIVEYGAVSEKRVSGDYIVYVSEKDRAKITTPTP